MRGFSWKTSIAIRRNAVIAGCISMIAIVVYAIQFSFVSEGVVCAEVHRSGLSDYGQVDLGESRTKIPRDAVLSTERQGDYQAVYTDRLGVTYSIGYDEVLRKDINITENSPVLLPFGFKAEDSVADVLRKIRSRRDAPKLYVDTSKTNGFGTEIRTDPCLRNRVGAVFSLDIAFDDKGRMLFISTDTESD